MNLKAIPAKDVLFVLFIVSATLGIWAPNALFCAGLIIIMFVVLCVAFPDEKPDALPAENLSNIVRALGEKSLEYEKMLGELRSEVNGLNLAKGLGKK